MGRFFPDAKAARDFMRAECGWKDTDIDALANVCPLDDCVADYLCDECGYDTDDSL